MTIPGLTFDTATHVYRSGDGRIVPSVTQVLESAGLSGRPPGVSDKAWNYACERGTRVHQWCRYGCEDGETVPDEVAGYYAGWQKFLTDTNFVAMHWETIASDATYWYAGTIDIGGLFPRVVAMLDIKTSEPQPWHALQTAAYQRCLLAPGKRFALYLKENATYKLVEHTNRRDFDVFAAALLLNAWKGQA